ncbi:MAG: hypothetical protein ACREGH_01045 [Minisyncoccia bacterium]
MLNPSDREREAAVAAFIKRYGVKRCPTAIAAPSTAHLSPGDAEELNEYDRKREEKRRRKWAKKGARGNRESSLIQHAERFAFNEEMLPHFKEMIASGLDDVEIAPKLNERGLQTLQGRLWNISNVQWYRKELGI